MSTAAGRQRGFTLLEILVAFVMLALVGGALLQLFQGGLQNLSSGDGYSRAALFAESTLSGLRAESTLEPGHRSGDLSDGYRYDLALTPYMEDGAPLGELLKAELIIRWGAGGAERAFAVTTLLLPPGSGR